MSKKYNRVTFEEISSDFSHFEVVVMSFCRASDILLSARSILGNTPYKPKIAMVAFDEICKDVEESKSYKQELISRATSQYKEHEEEDYDLPVSESEEAEI